MPAPGTHVGSGASRCLGDVLAAFVRQLPPCCRIASFKTNDARTVVISIVCCHVSTSPRQVPLGTTVEVLLILIARAGISKEHILPENCLIMAAR